MQAGAIVRSNKVPGERSDDGTGECLATSDAIPTPVNNSWHLGIHGSIVARDPQCLSLTALCGCSFMKAILFVRTTQKKKSPWTYVVGFLILDVFSGAYREDLAGRNLWKSAAIRHTADMTLAVGSTPRPLLHCDYEFDAQASRLNNQMQPRTVLGL
jgi:hypothetical protein